MSYEPLARKYRPKKFSDLIGQEPTTLALLGGIRLERTPTGIILSGIRGVGKTTLARIYAKALNCSNSTTKDPCSECASCRAIAACNHEDVLEIDGASNNGVDEIRELKETVSYIPQRSQYKVYIIDEVHMLSASAFNALLKTLEEPPSGVVFIFATTELHKIPKTIIGRCQTFHLQKIAPANIIKRLEHILTKEQISFDAKALKIIANEGQGSLRDALTFLDQVIAIGEGEITLTALEKITGNISCKPHLQLIENLIEKKPQACIDLIDDLDQKGLDFVDVVNETVRLLRYGFLFKNLDPNHLKKQLISLDQDEIITLQTIASNAKDLDLNRLFRSFVQCLKDLDGSYLDRFVFENYCMEWCFDPGLPNIEALLEKTTNTVPKNTVRKPARPRAVIPTKPQETKKPLEEKNFPLTWKDLIEQWKKKKPLQARKLEEVYPLKFSEKNITLAVSKESIVGPVLLQKDTQVRLQKQFDELFGFKGTLQVTAKEKISPKDSKQNTPVLQSITEEKEQEAYNKKKALTEQANNHPVTKEILNKFNGRIIKTTVDQV